MVLFEGTKPLAVKIIAADLGPHLHDGLLEAVVVAGPGVPVHPVSEGAVRPAQIPAVQVGVVAVAVPPAALQIGKCIIKLLNVS